VRGGKDDRNRAKPKKTPLPSRHPVGDLGKPLVWYTEHRADLSLSDLTCIQAHIFSPSQNQKVADEIRQGKKKSSRP
jgi:hypothetical protein